MKLPVPSEPLELKGWMLSMKESHFSDPTIDWDSYVVWAGNKLPKYLWDHWKQNLKPAGLTWQKFMRLLRYRTDVGVMWYKGALPWNEFVARISNLIAGPIGTSLKKELGVQSKPPVDLAQWQIPPVRDWEKFERLCSDLWKKIWGDHNIQRNGRGGQRQHGIDIFGTIQRSGKMGGIQCKKKDATIADDALEETEIRAIVEDAKSFVPPLAELVIAYTGKRDAKLQREARRITEEHRTRRLFAVHAYSWDDILEALGDHRDVFEKHFPEFVSVNVNPKELDRRLANLENLGRDTLGLVTDTGMPSALDKLESMVRKTAQSAADSTAVTGEHSAEIDHARDLINALKPKEALDYLEKIEKRIWAETSDIIRFRILTNKAAALSSLGKEEDAGKLFIEAHQYNPDDEKALSNRAVGHLFLGQLPEAKDFAERVIQKNPVNGRAYGVVILCIPDSEPMETVIQSVPANIRKTEEGAYAIAAAARQRGDLAAAIQWLEVTLQYSAKSRKKNPDLRANLAAALLQPLMTKYEVLNGIQLTAEDRKQIAKAIDLLTEAINDLSGSESINYRTSWFTNRSTAYKLLGELDSALLDIETALRTRPNDPSLLKQKALILYSKGGTDPAIEILHKLHGKEEVPEASLMLAGILNEKGDGKRAKAILEDSLSREIPQALWAAEQRLLIAINLKRANYDRARQISAAMRAADPTDVLNLVVAARIEKQAGDVATASKLLDEARGYVTEKTPSQHLIELADELYALEKYPDAWPLYEQIADPRIDTPLTKHLLYSYYRANEVEKALDICKGIPAENKNPFVIQIELSILEDINDLKEAAAVAERYLETHPEDLQTRIRLAIIHFRREEFEKLDCFLERSVDIAKLPVDAGFTLTRLYAERGMMEKSLQSAYELRRAHFDNGEAHLKYVGILFGREHKLDDILSAPGDARVGSAVHVQNDAGVLRWHLLEDRADVNAPMNELNVASDLGKKLLGKKVGEEVLISQTLISETKVKVVEIKSKYVYALHESLELLPERFAETKGIERVTIATGTDEETRESIQKMLAAVSKRTEWIMQAEKFYRESKLTVGAFSQLIGRSVIDVWSGLVGSKWGVKSCLGSLEEREEAFALLEKHSIVAMDITALLTAAQLELLPTLEKKFDKILISQSTIDLLQEAISERKGVGSRGYATIWKEGDGFLRREITAEDVSNQIEYIQRVKDWAKKHCEVTPCRAAQKLAQRKEFEKLIGPCFLETILIAQEHGCPLYTDDFGTKALAKNDDFRVPGVWTQVVAMQALSRKQITEGEYKKAVICLVLLNYRHTTINAAIILEAAKEAKWSNARPFTEVLETLRGSQMEIHSAVSVLAEFIFMLWQQPIIDFQRDTLVVAILDVLTDHRDDRLVLRLVRGAIKTRFRLLPLAQTKVQQIVSAWEGLRGRPI